MIKVIKGWIDKHFSDPQAIILISILILGTILVLYWGAILTPILAGIVIAYVLEGLVKKLSALSLPRMLAFLISYALFLTALAFILFGLVPLVISQVTQLLADFPQIASKIQELVLSIPEHFPMLPEQQIEKMLAGFTTEMVTIGQRLLTASLASAVGVFTVLFYLVVVPILVFFLLKDKVEILQWFRRFMPGDRTLASSVWKEMDAKMGNYIRGKLLEIIIVGVAMYIPLKFLGMSYAAVMSLLVGLSVIIPYVGAVAVTIPVAMVAWFQWGSSSEFIYVMVAYFLVQFLDGNVLVPLLFSEMVNINPAAIIIAVLFFGGLWGMWGVFFAIPLATLVQAVINSWPSIQHHKSV